MLQFKSVPLLNRLAISALSLIGCDVALANDYDFNSKRELLHSPFLLVDVEQTEVMRDYSGNSETDLALATVEFGFSAAFNDNLNSQLSFLYEEDATDPEVDLAVISFANFMAHDVAMHVGQMYLPFGHFETALVNDTVILELAEVRDLAAAVTYQSDRLAAQLFTYDNNAHPAGSNWNNVGLNGNFQTDVLQLGFSVLGDILSSESFQSVVSDSDIYANHNSSVPAAAVHAGLNLGNWFFYNEVFKSRAIEFATAEGTQHQRSVRAKHLEMGYRWPKIIAAAAWQQTTNAQAFELPVVRSALGLQYLYSELVHLNVEFWRDRSYRSAANSNSQSSKAVVMQLQLILQ